MLKIGEFSKLSKTTIKTLRYYDEIDLLKPIFVDSNGYRYYEIEQLNDILMIVELRNLDMSINDIKSILATNNAHKVLSTHLCELETELNRKEKQILLIKNYIEKAKRGEFMQKYKVNIKTIPNNIVYYKKGVLDTMADMFDFVLQTGAEAKAHNPNLQCKNYCYVTYSAKEYKEKNIEIEYVEAVTEFGKESENIKFREEPQISVISVEHKGKYEDLSKAYAYAVNWVKEKNYQINGAIREVYIDGCWNKDKEEDYLTEIQIPIEM